MKTIHKFKLIMSPSETLYIDGFIKALSVINQQERLVLYVERDDSIFTETKVEIAIIGTGHDNWTLDKNGWGFLNTVSVKDDLIWHIYCRSSVT